MPGSVFLNILAGALYGVWQGFLMCCLLTACGASQCYLLARLVGANTAQHYFPEKIASFKAKLDENRVRPFKRSNINITLRLKVRFNSFVF